MKAAKIAFSIAFIIVVVAGLIALAKTETAKQRAVAKQAPIEKLK